MLDTREQVIYNLYSQLLRTIDANNKIKLIHNSIYLTLVKKNPNDVIKCLIDSSITKGSIDNATMNFLKKEKMVFEFNGITDSYLEMIAINAHGIFYWEKKNKIINTKDVISILNTNWENKLPKSENRSLTTKERLVLLVLLSMRSFNINHCLNATDQERNNYRPWLTIFRDCDKFISSNKLDKHFDKLDNERIGNQDTVFAIVSRIEHLQSKSNMVLDNGKTKKKCYFLDTLDSSKNIDIKKLSQIMNLICENNSDAYTSLLSFCASFIISTLS